MKRDYIQREIVGMPGCTLHIWKDHWKITYKDVELVHDRIGYEMKELIEKAETYFNNIVMDGNDKTHITGDFCIHHEGLREIKLVGIIKDGRDVETYIEVVRTGEKIHCGKITKLRDSWTEVERIASDVWRIINTSN